MSSVRPQLKLHLLQHWDEHESLQGTEPTYDWPYDDASCLAMCGGQLTLSRAFIEHASMSRNYTLNRKILKEMPVLGTYVRD